ncbi:Oidioi.mRNA.OKI2018_I69.chr1.g769.t2.cds [Oikopleura dioica]|uniref:Oidioi.mRNA.OKI2018_I69.chr1.g769.t2.cds n=1 Tax=Oikopleura dioica TaxID=34765 RepID=A0ABN7SML7_OIKDI|nr:Oidioi.mRNA.OKI2018_I69.chr1.g769.t2.cds [Oikopleura dioica]
MTFLFFVNKKDYYQLPRRSKENDGDHELHLKIINHKNETAEEACLKSILLQEQQIEQQRRIISSLDRQIAGLLAPTCLGHFDQENMNIQKNLEFIENRANLLKSQINKHTPINSMRRSATLNSMKSTRTCRWPSMNNLLRPSFSENNCSKFNDLRDSDSDTGFSSMDSSDNEYLPVQKVHKAETLVNGMSNSNGTDIVLPMIGQHKGQMITTGVVRKKSTPKMISAKRYFELYGQGDIKTQMFLKTLQQTLGDDHFETYERLLRALKVYTHDRNLDLLFEKLTTLLCHPAEEFILHALRGFLPTADRPRFDNLLRENRRKEDNNHQPQPILKSTKPNQQPILPSAPPAIPKLLRRPKSGPLPKVQRFTPEKFERPRRPDLDFERMNNGNVRKLVIRKTESEGFGFTIKGEYPVTISDIKPGSPAEKSGIQIGDQLLSVNEISIKNFNRSKIVQILTSCGPNPVLVIIDNVKLGKDATTSVSPTHPNSLSRADISRMERICNEYRGHKDFNRLGLELGEEFTSSDYDRTQFFTFLENFLSEEEVSRVQGRFERGGRTSSAGSNRSFSGGSDETSMRKALQRKMISSHETVDGINFQAPKARHMSARKGSGRRKCWKTDSSPSLPPPATPSIHSEDSLENENEPTSPGFQQKLTSFARPPPPPSPEPLPAETPNKDGRIRSMLKTSIKPMIHHSKAQNLSILLTHLRSSPHDVARCLITGNPGKLDVCHLKTLLKNLPDEKELQKILEKIHSRAEINEADALAHALMSISDAPLRLKCMIFKMEFDGRGDIILPIFNLMTKAATSLRKSEKFGEICKLILTQGMVKN